MDISSDLDALLRSQRIARLATADEHGAPHVVPIVFAYENGRVFTPVDAKPKSVPPERLRRVRNILANPSVQVLLDHYEEDWGRLWYVQLRGRARLLDGGAGYEEGRRLLEARYSQYSSLPLAGRPIIDIEVRRVVSWGRPPAAKEVG